MRFIITTICLLGMLLMSHETTAQETYWKVKDMSGEEGEVPYDQRIVNDTVYIWANGSCDGLFCMHYYVFTQEGELVLFREYPGLVSGKRVAMDDKYFYIALRNSADTLNGFASFRLGKFDLKGDLVATEAYTIEDAPAPLDLFKVDLYHNYGCVAYDGKLVLYGAVEHLADNFNDRRFQVLLMWYDQNDLSLDTMMLVDPVEHDVIWCWDALVDDNGLLTLLVEYRDRGDHLVLVKYLSLIHI